MSKYVEVKALEKAIIENAQDLRTLSTKTVGQAISSLPTIDIVRCKDCKWFVADKPLKLKDGTEVEDNYCSRPNQQSCFLKPSDFCSYGERIDNEQVRRHRTD